MNYSKQEFERLFKDSYPHMYRMAFSMVENADDAKDAVHQVFAQIWRRKPHVADEKGAPLAEANVGIGFVTPWDAITTDRNGHFDLWMPFRDATISVNHAGYITQQIQPTDTALVIHMKDATKLRIPGIGLRRKIK